MSLAICFLLTFVLILINAVMGIFIGLDYYLLMAGALTIALTICVSIFDFKKIVTNKSIVSTKNKSNANANVKRKRQQSVNSKRRIS